jgi:putative hemolysin
MESIWLEIVLIAVGILANGFFAGSEFALVSARISRLAQLRDAGVVGAAVAMRLKEAPDRFLATIQIAITAVGTLASAVGGVAAVEALTPALATVGLGTLAQPAALALVIVAITYVSLVLGELAPKAVALRDPERLATLVAPVIAGLSRLSARLVRLLTGSTNLLLRLVGLSHAETSPFVSEEDVRYLLREGAARGVFEKVEEELVHNVFEFADTTVREIMTPRTRIAGLDLVTPAPDVLARTVETGHSRIPVYDGSLDRIVGVVTLKDVARCVARGEAPALAALIRLPVFVPATVRISGLLREMQRTRQGLALVVDEYGSVVGLVTVEDVVEEIVGEIQEEGEASPSPVHRLPDGSLLLDGTTPIEQIEAALGIALPGSRDYTTVAGFILTALNSVPARGTSLVAAGRRWTVLDVEGPRILRIKVETL